MKMGLNFLLLVLYSVSIIGGASSATTAFVYNCGEHIAHGSGEIRSPFYPSNYGNGVDCTWVIDRPSNQEIYLDILDFSTERCCDKLRIINLNNGYDLAELSGNCGSYGRVYTSSNRIKLSFRTDGSVVNRGFRIRFGTRYMYTGGTTVQSTVNVGDLCVSRTSNAVTTSTTEISTGRFSTFGYSDVRIEYGSYGIVYINGRVVCDVGFDSREGEALCHSKGYSYDSYRSRTASSHYGTSEVSCRSGDLYTCSTRPRHQYCYYAVYLYCSYGSTYYSTTEASTIQDKSTHTIGYYNTYIEYGNYGRVYVDGKEVCYDSGFNSQSGEAICESKGYQYYSYSSTSARSHYNTYELQCTSRYLFGCYTRQRDRYCSRAVYLTCYGTTTEDSLSTVSYEFTADPSNIIIEYGSSGRVNIGYEVCVNNGFNYRTAEAVCRSKGYTYSSYTSTSPYNNYRTTEIHCSSYDINSCSIRTRYNYCSAVLYIYCNAMTTEYAEETTVSPYETSPGYTRVRLVGTGYQSRGTIEVLHNGQWGTICDDSFDRKDGDVICRMLGYNFARNTYQSAHYGQGSGPIWLDDVACSGYESDISYCGSGGWGSHNCNHGEDAGVDCVYQYPTTKRYETTTYNPCTMNSCHNGGTCYSKGYYYSGYYCVCPQGYTGRDCTYETTTYDPCYASSCRHGGTCYSNYGYPGYYCQCPAGYTGQHCDNSIGFSAESVISVGCADNTWDVSVYLPPLYNRYSDFNPNDIYLGTDSCTGYVSGNYLHFRSDYTACGTTSKTTVDNILYTNELTYALHDPNHHFIIHEYRFRVPVDCYLARAEGSSGHFNHGHDVTVPASHHVTGSSHHTVYLQFYRDSSFTYTKPLYGSKVGDIVYVKAYTDVRDYNLKMRLSDCFTTPTSSAYSNMKYFIIQNGCTIDPNARIMSQTTHETRFYFQDFEYATNHDSLFLHCNATFCKSNDYSAACEQTCHNVYKRLGGGNIVMDGPLESASVSDAVRLNSGGSTDGSSLTGQLTLVAVLAAVLGIFVLTLAAFMIWGKIKRVRRAKSQVV